MACDIRRRHPRLIICVLYRFQPRETFIMWAEKAGAITRRIDVFIRCAAMRIHKHGTGFHSQTRHFGKLDIRQHANACNQHICGHKAAIGKFCPISAQRLDADAGEDLNAFLAVDARVKFR